MNKINKFVLQKNVVQSFKVKFVENFLVSFSMPPQEAGKKTFREGKKLLLQDVCGLANEFLIAVFSTVYSRCDNRWILFIAQLIKRIKKYRTDEHKNDP